MIYRLEKRILFDAALAAEADPLADGEDNLFVDEIIEPTDVEPVNGEDLSSIRNIINQIEVLNEDPAPLENLLLTTEESSDLEIVNFGSEWLYLDDGSDLGLAWRELNFDDSSWQSGSGQFGYGDGTETTTLSFGPDRTDKFITTYFRHEFEGQVLNNDVILEMLRDDGAVIYLNGIEVARSNMPDGEIDYLTRAKFSIAGAAEQVIRTFTIDQDSFNADGMNILAVELHQITPSSSDVRFDLRLRIPSFAQIEDATVELSEAALIGDFVYDVNNEETGNDRTSDGFRINYSISEGNDNGAFRIDSDTGVISVNRSDFFDFETLSVFNLTVTENQGTFSDTAIITVNLIDEPFIDEATVEALKDNGTFNFDLASLISDANSDTVTFSNLQQTSGRDVSAILSGFLGESGSPVVSGVSGISYNAESGNGEPEQQGWVLTGISEVTGFFPTSLPGIGPVLELTDNDGQRPDMSLSLLESEEFYETLWQNGGRLRIEFAVDTENTTGSNLLGNITLGALGSNNQGWVDESERGARAIILFQRNDDQINFTTVANNSIVEDPFFSFANDGLLHTVDLVITPMSTTFDVFFDGNEVSTIDWTTANRANRNEIKLSSGSSSGQNDPFFIRKVDVGSDARLLFETDGLFDDLQPGDSETLTFEFDATDGNLDSEKYTFSVVINGGALPPDVTGSAVDPLFSEDGDSVKIFRDISIDNVQVGILVESFNLDISNVTNDGTDILIVDEFEIRLVDGLSGSTSGLITGQIIDYNISIDGSTATLNLSSDGVTASDAVKFIESLRYRHDGDFNEDFSRVISLTQLQTNADISNGGFDTGFPDVSSTVSIEIQNNRPLVSAIAQNPIFIENGPDTEPIFSNVSLDPVETTQSISRLLLAVNGVVNEFDEYLIIDGTKIIFEDGTLGTTLNNGYVYEVASNRDSNQGAISIFFDESISISAVENLAENIIYGSSLDDPGSSRSINLRVADLPTGESINFSTAITSTITITQTNDAPIFSATALNPVFTEGNSPVLLFRDTANSALESNQEILTALIQVDGLVDGSHEILRFDDTDIILVDGFSGVTRTNSILYTVSVSATTATIELSQSAQTTENSEETNRLFNNAAYFNSAKDASDGIRNVRVISITDDGGTDNGGFDTAFPNISSAVTVVGGVNNAPINFLPPEQTVIVNGILTISSANDNLIYFNDPDAEDSILSVLLSASNGILSLNAKASIDLASVTGDNTSLVLLSGSQDQLNNALNGLTYRPAADFSGSDFLTIIVNDRGNSGIDTGLSGDDFSEEDIDVLTINVRPVNQAPTISLSSNNLSVDEATLLNLAVLSISDVDNDGSNNNSLSLSANSGILTFTQTAGITFESGTNNSSSFTVRGDLTNLNNALASLTYINTQNEPNAFNDIVEITINDNAITGALQTSEFLNIRILPVNNSPEFTITSLDFPDLVEDSNDNGLTVLELLTAAGYTDSDIGAVPGLALTNASDFEGGIWQFSQNDGGSWAEVPSVSTSAALLLAEQARIRFLPNSNFSSDNDFDGATETFPSISFYAWDRTDSAAVGTTATITSQENGSFSTNEANAKLTVAPVNDSPIVISPEAIAVNETQLINLPDISWSDFDSSIDEIFAVSIRAEKGLINLTGDLSGLTFTAGDPSATPVDLITFSGSELNVNQALESLAFQIDSGIIPLSGGFTKVSISIADEQGGVGITEFNILVNQTNNAPQLAADIVIGLFTPINEEDISNNGDSVADIVASLNGGSDPISDEDNLDSRSDFPEGIAIVDTFGFGEWQYGSGGTSWMTLPSGSLDDPDLAFLLAADSSTRIRFVPDTNISGDDTAGIEFHAWDTFGSESNTLFNLSTSGTGGSSPFSNNTAFAFLDINNINDRPEITVPSGQNLSEDDSLIFSAVNNNAIVISDDDSTGSDSASLNLSVSNGLLSLSSTEGLAFDTGSNNSATMIVTGSFDAINSALEGLIYLPMGNFNGTDSIIINLSDTDPQGPLSTTDSISLSISATNDAPILSLPVDINSDEEQEIVFSVANGNAISVNDSDFAEINGALGQITISVDSGDLNLGGFSATQFNGSAVNSTSQISFNATIEEMNSALDGLTFTPEKGFNGIVQLSITVSDLGFSGEGGELSDSGIVMINILQANTAPQLSLLASSSEYSENTPDLILSPFALVEDDGLLQSASVSIKDNLNPSQDSLSFTALGNVSGIYNPLTGVLDLSGADTAETYSEILRSISYRNSSDDPSPLSRTLEWFVGDNDFNSPAVTSSINIIGVNDSPTISADTLSAVFTEGDSPLKLVDNVSLSTVEIGQSITNVVLIIEGLADGDSEVLEFDGISESLTEGVSGISPSAYSYNFTNTVDGSLRLDFNTANASTQAIEGFFVSLRYINTSESPTEGDRLFGVEAIIDDGGSVNGGDDTLTPPNFTTITVEAINDPAIFSFPSEVSVSEKTMTRINGISINDIDNNNSTVKTLTLSIDAGTLTVSTINKPSIEFINNTKNNTSFIQLLGGLSDLNLLLDELVYNAPQSANSETVTFDLIFTETEESSLDTSVAGSFEIKVLPENDAPSLSRSDTFTIIEDSNNNSTTVALVLNRTGFNDPDLDTIPGLAITGSQDLDGGTWEYRLENEDLWQPLPENISINNALLLGESDLLRFNLRQDVFFVNSEPLPSISFFAWDQTDMKEPGDYTDISELRGGNKAFGAEATTADIIVEPQNDAPLLIESEFTIENLASVPLNQIINRSAIEDADGKPSLGIAITSVDNGIGQWQYSLDGGKIFLNLTDELNETSAVLINQKSQLRFNSPSLFAEDSGELAFRIWDQSSGFNGQTGVDVSINGSTSAFSTAVGSIRNTASVDAINSDTEIGEELLTGENDILNFSSTEKSFNNTEVFTPDIGDGVHILSAKNNFLDDDEFRIHIHQLVNAAADEKQNSTPRSFLNLIEQEIAEINNKRLL